MKWKKYETTVKDSPSSSSAAAAGATSMAQSHHQQVRYQPGSRSAADYGQLSTPVGGGEIHAADAVAVGNGAPPPPLVDVDDGHLQPTLPPPSGTNYNQSPSSTCSSSRSTGQHHQQRQQQQQHQHDIDDVMRDECKSEIESIGEID